MNFNFCYYVVPNKILILGKVGFQSDQITAASWSGNTCPPSNQLIITLIRLLFGFEPRCRQYFKLLLDSGDFHSNPGGFDMANIVLF